ncbi:hypothetical protein BC828DRAFT_372141 [Blastocladiella britannica]|nr:hypothetical protein BC828DRAFT_372141 [Blastocladiella britannica]
MPPPRQLPKAASAAAAPPHSAHDPMGILAQCGPNGPLVAVPLDAWLEANPSAAAGSRHMGYPPVQYAPVVLPAPIQTYAHLQPMLISQQQPIQAHQQQRSLPDSRPIWMQQQQQHQQYDPPGHHRSYYGGPGSMNEQDRSGPATAPVVVYSPSPPNAHHIAPLVEQLRRRRSSVPRPPTVPKPALSTSERYEWLHATAAAIPGGGHLPAGFLTSGYEEDEEPEEVGAVGTRSLPSGTAGSSTATGATSAARRARYTPYSGADYAALHMADMSARLPKSLGPPGGPAEDARRRRAEAMREYAERVRMQRQRSMTF